ncbi:hypothetical protein [Sphingomonas sp.]|uniref:hypothetical protein n=1 Tax=Sphingomonas sp. TaxID=28214 RepID=UPI003D6CCF3A
MRQIKSDTALTALQDERVALRIRLALLEQDGGEEPATRETRDQLLAIETQIKSHGRIADCR